MEGWLHLPTRNKSTLALRELSAGLSSLKQFKLDEAMKHFEGTYGRTRANEHIGVQRKTIHADAVAQNRPTGYGALGSTASTPTVFPATRAWRIRQSVNVRLPAPGGP